MGFFNFLYRVLRRSSLRDCLHGDDCWALVTGGSDGIGKGFVEELLKEGFNVLVHGRNLSKLEKLVEELRAGYPKRQIEILCFDAAKPDITENVNSMVTQIGDRKLTALVNNVGFSTPYHPFVFQSTQEQLDIIRVQASFPTLLISALLPTLAKNEPSMILNVGGLTSQYPVPLLSVHSGAKAYFMTFTEGLAEELRNWKYWEPEERKKWISMKSSSSNTPPKIYIHAINVHEVSSNSNPTSLSFFVPTSRRMARAALNVVGCGSIFVTAYWRHAIMGALLQLLPRSMVESAIAKECARLRALGPVGKKDK